MSATTTFSATLFTRKDGKPIKFRILPPFTYETEFLQQQIIKGGGGIVNSTRNADIVLQHPGAPRLRNVKCKIYTSEFIHKATNDNKLPPLINFRLGINDKPLPSLKATPYTPEEEDTMERICRECRAAGLNERATVARIVAALGSTRSPDAVRFKLRTLGDQRQFDIGKAEPYWERVKAGLPVARPPKYLRGGKMPENVRIARNCRRSSEELLDLSDSGAEAEPERMAGVEETEPEKMAGVDETEPEKMTEDAEAEPEAEDTGNKSSEISEQEIPTPAPSLPQSQPPQPPAEMPAPHSPDLDLSASSAISASAADSTETSSQLESAILQSQHSSQISDRSHENVLIRSVLVANSQISQSQTELGSSGSSGGVLGTPGGSLGNSGPTDSDMELPASQSQFPPEFSVPGQQELPIAGPIAGSAGQPTETSVQLSATHATVVEISSVVAQREEGNNGGFVEAAAETETETEAEARTETERMPPRPDFNLPIDDYEYHLKRHIDYLVRRYHVDAITAREAYEALIGFPHYGSDGTDGTDGSDVPLDEMYATVFASGFGSHSDASLDELFPETRGIWTTADDFALKRVLNSRTSEKRKRALVAALEVKHGKENVETRRKYAESPNCLSL